MSDSAKRWSRLFKKKKFKGVSYKDFVTEVDADISAILKNDIDKLFDEDKEYLFMSVPLQEETQEFRKTAKGIEASLNKLYDKKSKITKDASVIRMPYVETEFDAIIKAIQNDVVVICKQLDKLDATLAPIEDELASANYQIKQKSLVLTRRQQEIDTVISNIEKALKQVAYKEFLFDYISTLKNLIDNPANNPADIEYINTMLGLDSEIITDYDNIVEYVDNRGALAMSTSQVKSFIISIETAQEERFVFDYAIIDEASKCNIADLIVSLPNIKKLILIGDYMHLDPSFTQYEKLDDLDGWVPKAITTEEKWQALNLSNFRQMFKVVKEQMEERSLQDYYSVSNVAILKRQYKMNEDIFSYVKDIYAIHEGFELIDEKRYGGKDILPLQIDGDEVIENDFIDKIYNPKEIEFVKDLVQNLSKNIDKYNNIKSIGIIGLYDWHTRLIKYQIDALDLDKTFKKSGVSISIGTVEKMQNKEFDMVILSCVKTKELGNLSDVRILNAALSRA